MSRSVTGIMLWALKRRDGMRAYRLSTMVSSVPEKTLLNPRATMLLWVIPVWTMSIPASPFRFSAGVGTIVRSISSLETTEIDAGASRAFSWRRDAVTTTGLSTRARERSETSTLWVVRTPSTRAVS